MPIHLPPSAETTVVPAWSPMETQLPSDLRAAYDDTLKAWGGRWVGVQLTLPGQPLPSGLQALLNRENPALSQTLNKQGQGSRFLFDPTLSEAQQAQVLAQQDHQLLALWVKEGWINTLPANQVSFDPEGGSDAGRVFTDHPSVTMSGLPQNALPKDILTRGVDPVALRWLVLAHEASHLQQLGMTHVFQEATWTPDQNAAMNLLLFEVPGDQSMTGQVYAESFADVYGAMMALSLTRSAPMMRQTLATFLSVRQATTDQEDQQFATAMAKGVDTLAFLSAAYDPHRTAPALRQMLADEQAGTLDLTRLTPAELRQKAESYASASVVAFLESPMGQALHEWSWGRDQDVTQGLSAPALLTANEEKSRLAQYLIQRMLTYETEAGQGRSAPPPVQADPLLAHFGVNDAQWRARYLQLPTADRQAMQQMFATGNIQMTPGLNAYFNQAQADMAVFLAQKGTTLHQTLAAATTEVEQALSPVSRRSALADRVTQVLPLGPLAAAPTKPVTPMSIRGRMAP